MDMEKVYKVFVGLVAVAALGFVFYSNYMVVEPPEIVLEIEDQTFKGADGSNCWKRSPFSARCVDTIGPAGLLEMSELENISVEGGAYIEPETVGYREPKTYQYRILTYNNSVVEQGSFTDRKQFTRTGHYILEISANWDRGDAHYVFPVALGGLDV